MGVIGWVVDVLVVMGCCWGCGVFWGGGRCWCGVDCGWRWGGELFGVVICVLIMLVVVGCLVIKV